MQKLVRICPSFKCNIEQDIFQTFEENFGRHKQVESLIEEFKKQN